MGFKDTLSLIQLSMCTPYSIVPSPPLSASVAWLSYCNRRELGVNETTLHMH